MSVAGKAKDGTSCRHAIARARRSTVPMLVLRKEGA
jgi:hypothetical protein